MKLSLEYLVAEFVNIYSSDDGEQILLDSSESPRPLFLREDDGGRFIYDPVYDDVFPLTAEFVLAHRLGPISFR